MTRDQAVARIQQGLGFRPDKATEIANILIERQRQLERGRTLPLFLLVEDASLTLSASTNSISLPSNFLRRASSRIRYTVSGQNRPEFISWKDYEDSLNAYEVNYSAGPQVAVLRNSTILFAPTADKEYTLTWDYYKKADVLSTGSSTNEWLDDDYLPELLIGEAGMAIAKDLRDKEAIAIFAQMAKDARDALFKDTILQEDDVPHVMGANN
jgi:hypothetical protein